jgi:bifunctional non-homologous end joining protein LigD
MSMAFDFCIPTRGTEVPHTPDWIHEIKYDGYRLRLERGGDRVRLITRNGYDWSKRYPWIVESALKNRQKRFVIDGEAVILGVDGRSDFDALHSGRHNEEVQLYAFDMLAGDGDDMRQLPLFMRKANLARLLVARRSEGQDGRHRSGETPVPQRLLEQFPSLINRENISKNRDSSNPNRENQLSAREWCLLFCVR